MCAGGCAWQFGFRLTTGLRADGGFWLGLCFRLTTGLEAGGRLKQLVELGGFEACLVEGFVGFALLIYTEQAFDFDIEGYELLYVHILLILEKLREIIGYGCS